MGEMSLIVAANFQIGRIGANLQFLTPRDLAELSDVDTPEEGFIKEWAEDPPSHGLGKINDTGHTIGIGEFQPIPWEWDDFDGPHHSDEFAPIVPFVKGKARGRRKAERGKAEGKRRKAKRLKT
jgi:hypothetical protein